MAKSDNVLSGGDRAVFFFARHMGNDLKIL
jgi:hypothetical protein